MIKRKLEKGRLKNGLSAGIRVSFVITQLQIASDIGLWERL